MAELYKLKTINFLGRRVPIVVQNENGPCPMLALANVMLLRNQIHLSPEAPDVTQERLLSLIAGHLLDVNAKGGVSEEQAANMTRIIADAVELLPKLTTGIDVNVIFNDIRGFEYTDAIAIFDLLDIHLVHGWLVDPQDHQTAAAIGGSSYNAVMERMVALTGRASLTPAASFTPAASQHSEQPAAAATSPAMSATEEAGDAGKASLTPVASQHGEPPAAAATTPAMSATEEAGDAGKGSAAEACEGAAGLPPQHTGTPLQTEGRASVDSSALSSADAQAAEPVSGANGAAAPASMPEAESKTDAASEHPEAAGRAGTDNGAAKTGVHAADTSEAHPTGARQGLSEADELDFALKLSLNNAEQGSAASPVPSAAHTSADCMQLLAAVQSSPKGMREGTESPPEQPAGAHAAVTAGVPISSLSHAAEGHHHAEEVDHDFVVVEPEEAPGVGFEEANMPKMGIGSAGGSQELPSPKVSDKPAQSQQASDLPKETAEASTTHSSQRGLSSPCNVHDVSNAGLPAADPSTGAAAEQVSTTTDASGAESRVQPGPALDERAMALLAALPKPSPAEGCSAPPPELKAAGLLQQHPEIGKDAGKAASGSHQKASDDGNGQEPGSAAASHDQNACMGSTQQAYLIQAFLDDASSQLTEHGLVSLHQGLKPRQLAILFRNNHFNTLFKFEDALYLLVTDQGYLHEQDVVWEKLDAIDGNTVYVGSQIRPPGPATDSSAGDLQLAMQLQQQEEEEHQQRMAAQRQQSGQPAQAPAAQAAPSGPQTSGRSRHGPGPSHAHHRRGRGAYRSQRHGQAAPAAGTGSSSSRDCTIM